MSGPSRQSEPDSERLFLDRSLEWHRIFAEAWGTFLLVLVAAGADVASVQSGEFSKAVGAVAPGVLVMAVIYFMGAVSGAHINPAVTLAFALRRNFPWARVPGYVLAQLAGAALAAAFLRLLFASLAVAGATSPAPGLPAWKAVVLEAILTAGLVNTILGTASGARNIGTNAGIAVGGYIAIAGLWASPFTGASMNPARSFGPDLLRGEFSTTWIYLAGPLLGAALGVLFEWLLVGPPTAAGAKAAQGEKRRSR